MIIWDYEIIAVPDMTFRRLFMFREIVAKNFHFTIYALSYVIEKCKFASGNFHLKKMLA